MSRVDGHKLRRAMSSFATGIGVVTTRGGGGEPLATTVNSLTSVSLSPPLLLICLRRDSETLAAIRVSGKFTVNILAEHQDELSTRFASQGKVVERGDLALVADHTAAPVLSEALAHIHCRTHRLVDGGDHEIVIGEAVELTVDEHGERGPLLFFRSEYSRLQRSNDGPSIEPEESADRLLPVPPARLHPPDGSGLPETPIRLHVPDIHATVAIIGGGAAGTLTAVQLLRNGPRGLRVVVIEREHRIGPGVAYGTDRPFHLLNVPAVQMITLPNHPRHFLEWAKSRDSTIVDGDYLPRAMFGEYLEGLLSVSERQARGRVVLERCRDEAIALRPLAGERDNSLGYRVELAAGRSIEADYAVLALGNVALGDPTYLDTDLGDLYVHDPWRPGALDTALKSEAVMLLGTGLTMVDVALSLGGADGPVVHAVSRSGLVPCVHTDVTPVRGRPIAVPTERCSLTELTTRMLNQIAVTDSDDHDWRQAFDSLRPISNQLWKSLSDEDRALFMSDLKRLWSVHRHRMAPAVGASIARLTASRRLRIREATIGRIRRVGDSLEIQMQSKHRDEPELLRVGRVINCTGPVHDPAKIDHALVRDMLAAGLVRLDPLGQGFDVDDEGAVVGSNGIAGYGLYAMGSLRYGRLLETTAIPEIAVQADRLVRLMIADIGRREGRSGSARDAV